MVSREKVLERRLARIEVLLNAIEITMLVQIPVSYIIALVRGLEISTVVSIVVLYLILSIAYIRLRRSYDRLFEEWGRGSPVKNRRIRLDEHDFIVIYAPVATVVLMLVTWLLTKIL